MKSVIQGWPGKPKDTFEQEVGNMTTFLDRRVSQYGSYTLDYERDGTDRGKIGSARRYCPRCFPSSPSGRNVLL